MSVCLSVGMSSCLSIFLPVSSGVFELSTRMFVCYVDNIMDHELTDLPSVPIKLKIFRFSCFPRKSSALFLLTSKKLIKILLKVASELLEKSWISSGSSIWWHVVFQRMRLEYGIFTAYFSPCTSMEK